MMGEGTPIKDYIFFIRPYPTKYPLASFVIQSRYSIPTWVSDQ